ncbi:MAG: hypothetical protein AB1813_12580 [Verrucomicrobiota bacterium]|jgi:hypothetical protein
MDAVSFWIGFATRSRLLEPGKGCVAKNNPAPAFIGNAETMQFACDGVNNRFEIQISVVFRRADNLKFSLRRAVTTGGPSSVNFSSFQIGAKPRPR